MANTGLHRRTQCAVARWNGMRIIRDVVPTKTPGLILMRMPTPLGTYTVTHQRSGCRIGDYCATIDEARDLAEALGFWTKECPGFWTLSADEMGTLSGMVSHIRRQLGKDERTL